MMPSISTRGMALNVTIRITRLNGLEQRVAAAAGSRRASSGPGAADLEGDLEARAPLVAVRHLDALQRLGQRRRRRDGDRRADQEREVDAQRARSSPQGCGTGTRSGRPGSAVSSSGFMASLASQIRQNCSGSPRVRAAIRSSRSPCATRHLDQERHRPRRCGRKRRRM